MPVPNKKAVGDATDFQSTSESIGVSDNNDKGAIMEEGGSVRMDGTNISDNESDTNTTKIREETNSDGEDRAQEISIHDNGGG